MKVAAKIKRRLFEFVNTSRKQRLALKLLERAKELIEPRSHWMQGVYYGIRRGRGFAAGAPANANCFCLVGAIRRASMDLRGSQIVNRDDVHVACGALVPLAIEKLSFDNSDDYEWHIVQWNDDKRRKKREVVELLDTAIEVLKSKLKIKTKAA